MASVAAQFVSHEDKEIMTADSAIVLRQFGCRFTGVHIIEHGRNWRRLLAFNHGDQCMALLKRRYWFMPWRLHHATSPFAVMTAAEFNDLLNS